MIPPMPQLTDDALERHRRRALATYFTAAALTSIAYIAFFTIAAIAAPEMTRNATAGHRHRVVSTSATANGIGKARMA